MNEIESKRAYTVKEAAAMLTISESQLRKEIAQGRVAAVRFHKRYVVTGEALLRALGIEGG